MDATTPEEIRRQRRLGWPDMHPEDYCHLCGRRNVASWWTPQWAWKEATDGLGRSIGTILCPQCFTAAWEQATGVPMTWTIQPDPQVLAARLRHAEQCRGGA